MKPNKSAPLNKYRRFVVHLDDEDLAELTKQASDLNLSKASYIRLIIRQTKRRNEKK